MKYLLLLLLLCAGCQGAAALTMPFVQYTLKDYSVIIDGKADAIAGANSMYIAVKGDVKGTIQYWGPEDDVLGMPPVLRWSKEIDWSAERRAFLIKFNTEGKFVTLEPVDWAVARTSMPHLPE